MIRQKEQQEIITPAAEMRRDQSLEPKEYEEITGAEIAWEMTKDLRKWLVVFPKWFANWFGPLVLSVGIVGGLVLVDIPFTLCVLAGMVLICLNTGIFLVCIESRRIGDSDTPLRLVSDVCFGWFLGWKNQAAQRVKDRKLKNGK